MKTKGEEMLEKLLGRANIRWGLVKSWGPSKDLTHFCESTLGMDDETIITSRLMEKIWKNDIWGKWIILKAITNMDLWNDDVYNDVLAILLPRNFEYLEEELAETLIKNRDVILPDSTAILIGKLCAYMPEFLRAVNAFDLGNHLYGVLMKINKPGWEKGVANIIIERKKCFEPKQINQLIRKLLINDLEQFERVIRECGIAGEPEKRLWRRFKEHQDSRAQWEKGLRLP